MDAGTLSIYAASAVVDAGPDELRAVLARSPDERKVAANQARKRLARIRRERDRAEALTSRLTIPSGCEDIRLHHCRSQDLEAVTGIGPESVDLILTDPPYGEAFVPRVADLAELAGRVLKPGGLLVMCYGHGYIDRAFEHLAKHLVFGWEAAWVWHGVKNAVHHRQVFSSWKPILIYSKGPWVAREKWLDTYEINVQEKDFHEWQQPLELFERLVNDFSGGPVRRRIHDGGGVSESRTPLRGV